MIKVSLPASFFRSTEIANIFNNLAHKIWNDPHTREIKFFKSNETFQSFQSEAEVKEFLLSKEFYTYEFDKGDPFWRNIVHLNWNTKLDNIMDIDCQTKTIKEFRESMNLDFFITHCDELKNLRGSALNVKEFKELAKQNFKLGQLLNPPDPIAKIFDYEKMITGENRNKILSKMDVPVCPYCNMSYTLDYVKQGKCVSTADVDHFYPKAIYPEYSLCLYNMIPACQVCNRRLKLKHKTTVQSHIDPHRESFEGTANFHITNLHDYRIDPSTSPNLELEVSEDNDSAERVRNSMEIFMLEERYHSVESYAKELTDKAQIYTTYYQHELENQIGDILCKASIKELVFGAEETEAEFGRRSLGKLRRDLLRQLEIYK